MTMEETIVRHNGVIAMGAAAIAFIVGGFGWALVALGAFSLGLSGRPVILHFNDLSGITRIGTAADLLTAGVFAFVAAAAGIAIAFELDRRDRILGKLAAATVLAAAVLLFIACAAIINVN